MRDGATHDVIGEAAFSILEVVEQMSTVRFGGAPEEFGFDGLGKVSTAEYSLTDYTTDTLDCAATH